MPTLTGSTENTLYYEDTGGPGRPIVLIHGWPLSGAAWKHQVRPLSEAGYRVITYDRRGFGASDKPLTGYDYDTLADDLSALVSGLDLREVTVVGFSMGGGEVARYVSRHGRDRLRSVVLAAAITPYLLQSSDNPEGPLEKSEAAKMALSLTTNSSSFFDDFTTQFFSAGDRLCVSEEERSEAISLCEQAAKPAALEAMTAFGATDFREDLQTFAGLPVLIVHGDEDGVVPFEGSGKRAHEALPASELRVIAGAPHGLNVSHAAEFNAALVDFLAR